jgi:hypothetical protein
MNHKKLENLKIQKYNQQQKIAQLRRVLFSQTNRDNSSIANSLREAEKRLIELTKEITNLEDNQTKGLILQETIEPKETTEQTRGRGTIRPKVEVVINIQLTTEHLPTAIYHLLNRDENPLLVCSIFVKNATKRMKVTSYIEGYSAHSVDTIEVKKNTTELIFQLPTLFPHRIKEITELTKATLHIKVEDLDGKIERESSYPISLLSRNSAMFSYFNIQEDKIVDLFNYLGVFVTPNQPNIIGFLRTIADFHPQKLLMGYPPLPKDADNETINNAKEAVTQQVEAIFDTLKELDLIYVNSVIDFNPIKKNFGGQRVRLPKETLSQRQANCLDGTLLYASLLEACSLNPAIVVISGHAFVAWESLLGSGEWNFLETTMIGYSSFEEACLEGEKTAKEHQEDEELWIGVLPINEIRAKGIMPVE